MLQYAKICCANSLEKKAVPANFYAFCISELIQIQLQIQFQIQKRIRTHNTNTISNTVSNTEKN